jgi:hypothetical protein
LPGRSHFSPGCRVRVRGRTSVVHAASCSYRVLRSGPEPMSAPRTAPMSAPRRAPPLSLATSGLLRRARKAPGFSSASRSTNPRRADTRARVADCADSQTKRPLPASSPDQASASTPRQRVGGARPGSSRPFWACSARSPAAARSRRSRSPSTRSSTSRSSTSRRAVRRTVARCR